ncbi:MAG TPA: hypothetical protein VFH43_14290 [Candidatus Kapabacteria bacterium]|nr:hypothetical protein [Candidatus Kapabacteria bacterium]
MPGESQNFLKKLLRELFLLLFLVFVAPALQAMAQAERRNLTRPVVLNVHQPSRRRTRHLERHYVTSGWGVEYQMVVT